MMKITRRVKSCRRTITVECPFCSTLNEVKVCGVRVEVEHWDGEMLDVKNPCEHFERDGER